MSGGPLGGTVGVRDNAESVESALADATTALEADGDLRNSRPAFEAAYIEGERTAAGLVMATAALGAMHGQWMPGHRGQVAASLLDARLAHALSFIDPRTTLALRLRIRAASEADYRSGENTRALAALDEARAAAWIRWRWPRR